MTITTVRKFQKKSYEEKLEEMSPEKKEFLNNVKFGRKDPVYFSENLLGVRLHKRQKLWVWMTTRTQRDKAFELGKILGKWKTKEDFILLLEKNSSFGKNIF